VGLGHDCNHCDARGGAHWLGLQGGEGGGEADGAWHHSQSEQNILGTTTVGKSVCVDTKLLRVDTLQSGQLPSC
jgi:hypothetical protein